MLIYFFYTIIFEKVSCNKKGRQLLLVTSFCLAKRIINLVIAENKPFRNSHFRKQSTLSPHHQIPLHKSRKLIKVYDELGNINKVNGICNWHELLFHFSLQRYRNK